MWYSAKFFLIEAENTSLAGVQYRITDESMRVPPIKLFKYDAKNDEPDKSKPMPMDGKHNKYKLRGISGRYFSKFKICINEIAQDAGKR